MIFVMLFAPCAALACTGTFMVCTAQTDTTAAYGIIFAMVGALGACAAVVAAVMGDIK